MQDILPSVTSEALGLHLVCPSRVTAPAGGPGTFVAVDKGQAHGFIGKTPGKLLVLFMPGGYEHFFMDWEAQGLVPGPELGALENSYGVTRP